MKKELQKQLFQKYPKIFRQKDLSPQETCMCFGIETGDGWYDLLDMLCLTIQSYVDAKGIPQVEAEQVKQKLGGLRFYINSKDNTINNIIEFFEALSYHTCETCGSLVLVEKVRVGMWITPLCETCCIKQRGKPC